MPYRRCPLFLVTGLAILIVALAVLLAFQALFSALGDTLVARVLGGIAIACLVMLVVDVLLLVGVLGMLAVHESEEPFHRPADHQSDNHHDEAQQL